MFTGLIERVGECVRVIPRGAGAALTIRHTPWEDALAIGESVAVQGACLTVTASAVGTFTCDVLKETLQRTNVVDVKPGASLNLERALRVGDRFGGHMVSGHVDGCGTIAKLSPGGDDHLLRITCDPTISAEIVTKGSIAIDGISLTVTADAPGWFEVAIIPHTWSHTSLATRQLGDRVNLETDMLGKYVRRYIEPHQAHGNVTMAHLQRAGIV